MSTRGSPLLESAADTEALLSARGTQLAEILGRAESTLAGHGGWRCISPSQLDLTKGTSLSGTGQVWRDAIRGESMDGAAGGH